MTYFHLFSLLFEHLYIFYLKQQSSDSTSILFNPVMYKVIACFSVMYNEPQRISPLAGAPPPTLPDSDDDNGLFSEDETDAQTTEYSKLMNLDEFEKRMGHCYLARVSGNNKN